MAPDDKQRDSGPAVDTDSGVHADNGEVGPVDVKPEYSREFRFTPDDPRVGTGYDSPGEYGPGISDFAGFGPNNARDAGDNERRDDGNAPGSAPEPADGVEIPPTISGPSRPNPEVQAYGGAYSVLFGILAARPGHGYWTLSDTEAYALGDATVRLLRRTTRYVPKKHAWVINDVLSGVVILTSIAGPRLYADFHFRKMQRPAGGNGAMSAGDAAALRDWQQQQATRGAADYHNGGPTAGLGGIGS